MFVEERLLQTAIEVATAAGKVLLELAATVRDIQIKGFQDLVTDADRASEKCIVDMLRDATPWAGLLLEESGRIGREEERWIVDPLDGTTNYSRGYPFYCTSIAFEAHGECIIGAIYAPALQELYVARRGCGATLNGKQISVSQTMDLNSAFCCAGFTHATFSEDVKHYAELWPHTRAIRHDGSAALDLAFVGAGRYDAYWERGVRTWDIAAGTVIIEEAGGSTDVYRGTDNRVDIYASNGVLEWPDDCKSSIAIFRRESPLT